MRLYALIIMSVLVLHAGCSKKNNPVEEPPPEEVIPYTALFKDTLYKNGFSVGHVQDGTPGVATILTYGGIAPGNPFWSIGQWNNYNNDLKDAVLTSAGGLHEYNTENASAVRINTGTGTVQLQLNTESEYGYSAVCPVNPRRAGDKWPHILLAYDVPQNDLLKISGKQEIIMAADFTIDEVENKIPAGTYNPDLHAAQFQWFITVQNRNMQDDGYGEYFWFGLSYYDSRHDFSPHYSARDGNTTGMFIYIPAMQQILGATGKTEPGKNMKVSTNVLPIIETAFELAKQRGYMQKTNKDDLHIASMNIGWELPGTYNVRSTIRKLNIYYR